MSQDEAAAIRRLRRMEKSADFWVRVCSELANGIGGQGIILNGGHPVAVPDKLEGNDE